MDFVPRVDASQSAAFRERFKKMQSKNKRREKMHAEAAILFQAIEMRRTAYELAQILKSVRASIENRDATDFLLSEIRDAKGLTLLQAAIQTSSKEAVEFFLEEIWAQLL